MLTSLGKMLRGFIFLCLIFAAIGKKMIPAKQAQCPDAGGEDRDDECSLCVVPSFNNTPHEQEDLLKEYLENGNIEFNDNGTHYLSWDVDLFSVADPDNITVSFNIWVEQEQMGRALQGCCGIPLSRGGCYVQDCVPGLTFLTVGYMHWTMAKIFSMTAMSACAPEVRPPARFFTICVHELTIWRKRYNCECAVYDSITGELTPGNHTSDLAENKTVWYVDEEPRQYQVCVFSMKKDDVMARGSLADSDNVMDSVAFNRGVFYMRNFSGFNGSVIDDTSGKNVNCTIRSFKGGEIFNISSIDLLHHLRPSNNETFTCLAPWPNGTEKYRPRGTHVKCMPQNATFMMSHVYEKKMMANNSFVSTMTVFIPLLGAIAMMAVICILGLALRKKFNKFMEEMKTVPEELDTVMQESYTDFASKLHSNYEEKEDCQALDREEKDRILSLRLKEEEKLEVYQISKRFEHSSYNYDPFQQSFAGHPPNSFGANGLHSDLLAGQENIDPCFVVCCHDTKSSGSFKSKGNDSGCQLSMDGGSSRHSFASDDEPCSPDVPYMVRHVPDDKLTLESDTKSPKRVSVVLCDVPCDGYWTKQSFRKKPTPDSVSRCSNDTGCGIDDGNEEENLGEIEYELNSKKHPFVKSSSKDSGVATGSICSNSLRDSMSDIDDAIGEEFEYSPKIFRASYAERIIVSCITAH